MPREPWKAGDYQLAVLGVLEDRAGNQIGKPFEVERLDRVESATQPTIVRRSFSIPAQ